MKLHKFIIATLIALLMGTFVVTNIFAQAASPTKFESALGDGKRSMEDYVADQGSFLIDFGLVLLGGCKSTGCSEKYKSGALQTTGDMIAGLYDSPPASGVYYFANMFNNFGIAKPVYAQTGTGFNALEPLLPIWRAFRNFTYVFFVILFAGVGLAIMFRMRLSPQAVITIQSALPRMISALILVTFSYAISGLVIDLMYVVIGLAALLFGGVTNNATGYQQQFLNGGFWDTVGALAGQLGLSPLENISNSIKTIGVGAAIGAFIGAFTAVGAGWGIAIGMTLVLLIAGILILVALFRLFLQLLSCYIAILILIVTAPLQIALGVIPGFPGFGSWFKNLVANVAAFPAVGIVLMLGLTIVENVNANDLWTPPYLLGFITPFANILIGLGVILSIHQIPAAIKNALGVRGMGIVPQAPGLIAGAPGMAGLGIGEVGIQRLEAPAIGAGRATGWDIGTARVLRRILRLR